MCAWLAEPGCRARVVPGGNARWPYIPSEDRYSAPVPRAETVTWATPGLSKGKRVPARPETVQKGYQPGVRPRVDPPIDSWTMCQMSENPSDVPSFTKITTNMVKMAKVTAPTARLSVMARLSTFYQVPLQSRTYDPNNDTFSNNGHY